MGGSTSLKERKVLLSIKDLTENPWKDIDAKFNSGDKIKGSFEKMNDSGIIIKLDDEIEGLIPMNKISKDQKKNVFSKVVRLIWFYSIKIFLFQ